VDCDIPANEARIFAGPAATAVISPPASIVAVGGEEELQVARVVRSEVLPSL